MTIDLTEEQAELLVRELDRIIENVRYFLSPRILGLREIRGMIKPYPPRPRAEPTKHYEPPRDSGEATTRRALTSNCAQYTQDGRLTGRTIGRPRSRARPGRQRCWSGNCKSR